MCGALRPKDCVSARHDDWRFDDWRFKEGGRPDGIAVTVSIGRTDSCKLFVRSVVSTVSMLSFPSALSAFVAPSVAPVSSVGLEPSVPSLAVMPPASSSLVAGVVFAGSNRAAARHTTACPSTRAVTSVQNHGR